MSQVDLMAVFSAILRDYRNARANEEFGSESKMYRTFVELRKSFEMASPITERRSLLVRASVGQGNWARVPWIAFLDGRETKSTMKGVYCAYLFKHDMTGFYLTLTQGISEHIKRLGTTDGLKLLIAKSDSIRSIVRSVRDHGFSSGEGIDLVDEARPNALYKAATVVSKFYVTGAIPETKTLFDDLTALLGVYDRYIT